MLLLIVEPNKINLNKEAAGPRNVRIYRIYQSNKVIFHLIVLLSLTAGIQSV